MQLCEQLDLTWSPQEGSQSAIREKAKDIPFLKISALLATTEIQGSLVPQAFPMTDGHEVLALLSRSSGCSAVPRSKGHSIGSISAVQAAGGPRKPMDSLES